jgi:GNAT superfamily N-acetyltransferase
MNAQVGWTLRRVVLTIEDEGSDQNEDSVLLWSQFHGDDSPLIGNPAHYYGMALCKNKNAVKGNGVEESPSESVHQDILLIAMYFAYSTWDGRCLHVDQLPRDKNCPVKSVVLLQVLAQIAIKLGCRRLLWMQTGDPSWSFVPEDIQPETLDEWLILKMDRPAMESYAGNTTAKATQHDSLITSPSLDRSTIETKIQQVCTDLQSSSSSCLKWRLVLGNDDSMKKDSESIFNLVKGLAEYEKEPDAVQCRASDYQLDGSGPHPLFYCLLLDDTSTSNVTCGMAFIYFGYTKGGRFLYLEDLYLEPAFRRKGGGTLALKSLAKIGISLNCSHLLWTALDWNQPALNLYSKMGAIVQDGLKISRYKDDDLVRFAKAAISTTT